MKILSVLKKVLFTTACFLSITTFAANVNSTDSVPRPSEIGGKEADIVEHGGKFNAGEMIMEHILDSHEWHIMSIGQKHISLPLPIIIYSSTKGLSVFSSSHFEHGHASYNGYKLNKEGHIESLDGSGLYDLSITKNTASMMFSVLLMAIIFISIANRYKNNPGKAPKGAQSLFEPFIIFIRDEIAKPSIGPKYYKYLPYLLTVFFFIWFNNAMGMIPILPFGANVTGNIAITLTLALFTFVITIVSANKGYWMHIVNTPGVPWWLKFPVPLMPVVEFLGVFIKPFVLMLRLFANITAGHIIPLGFFALIFIFGEMSHTAGMGVSVLSVAFSVFMGILELLVGFLQAYVFTLLSAMYFGMAIEEHHHDHAHAGHDDEPSVI